MNTRWIFTKMSIIFVIMIRVITWGDDFQKPPVVSPPPLVVLPIVAPPMAPPHGDGDYL